MSNQNDQHANSIHKTLETRVSYSINNYQPVISTIIGSDPLFYMDCTDEDILEEDVLLEADLDLMDSDFAALSKEIMTLDQLSSDFAYNVEQKLELFEQSKNSIFSSAKKEKITLEKLLNTLSQSRLAQSYIEFAQKMNVEIIHNNQIESSFYDRENQTISINSNLNLTMQVLLLSQELRRHWQHRQGVLLNPLHFHPDSAIIMNRSLNADLIASTMRIAWELQLAGQKDVWSYIENSSFSDLARAFVREAYLDFRTINNGQAATSVFEAWFLSDRCRMLDRKLIRQMLADVQGFVFDINNVHASVQMSFIASLGEMPYGKNYLAAHTNTILSDAIFTEVRDRSNSNFLWFIKFERTFRETEHDLQMTKEQSTSHSAMMHSHSKNAGSDHEQNIIRPFFGHENQEASLKAVAQGSKSYDTTNLVFLRAQHSE